MDHASIPHRSLPLRDSDIPESSEFDNFQHAVTSFATTAYVYDTAEKPHLIIRPGHLKWVTLHRKDSTDREHIHSPRRLPNNQTQKILDSRHATAQSALYEQPDRKVCADKRFSWSEHFYTLSELKYQVYIPVSIHYEDEAHDAILAQDLIDIEQKVLERVGLPPPSRRILQECSLVFNPDSEGKHWGCILAALGDWAKDLGGCHDGDVPEDALLRSEAAQVGSMALLTRAWHAWKHKLSSLSQNDSSTPAIAVTITVFSFTPTQLRVLQAIYDGSSSLSIELKEKFRLSDFVKDITVSQPTEETAYLRALSWLFSLPKTVH